MPIDTIWLLNEVAQTPITTNGKSSIPRTLRDELIAHLQATTPFKDRASVEEYLKGRGFEKTNNKNTSHEWESRDIAYHEYRGATIIDEPDGTLSISLTYEKGVSNPLRKCFRLTATPALLDSILEAK